MTQEIPINIETIDQEIEIMEYELQEFIESCNKLKINDIINE